MINWLWSFILSAASCRWSPSACRDSAWATCSLQLAENHVQLWTAPSTREGRPGGWVDRCRAGQRLLCSHQHESRQSHRTPLSHPSAAVHCHPFLSINFFLILIQSLSISVFYSLAYSIQLNIKHICRSATTKQQIDGLWTEREELKVIMEIVNEGVPKSCVWLNGSLVHIAACRKYSSTSTVRTVWAVNQFNPTESVQG